MRVAMYPGDAGPAGRYPRRMGTFTKALAWLGYSAGTGFDHLHDSGTVARSLGSPWVPSPTSLAGVDLPLGLAGAAGEAEALAVPPVTRGIALYSTLIAGLKIVAEDGSEAPRWMNHTADAVPSGNRWARVLQDLVFHGGSCLLRLTDGDDVRDCLHIPKRFWDFTPDGRLQLLGQPASAGISDHLVYIPSLLPSGFLTYAQDSIGYYRDIQTTIRNRGASPIPLVELHVTEYAQVTDAELVRARDDWSAARRAPGGSVAFTPAGVEARIHPAGDDGSMLIEARNAVRLDFANFLNINAALLEGNNGSSDTYSNTLQNQNELERLSLATWTTPIAARLSQDDITPAGVSVKFDTSAFDSAIDAHGNAGRAVEDPARIDPEERTP